MINPEFEELMWKSIDGAAGEEDHRRLQSHLEHNPGDREYYADLVAFSKLVDGVGEIEPPEVLAQLFAIRAVVRKQFSQKGPLVFKNSIQIKKV